MSFDLHCHSTFSDGTKSPTELVALAKESGLQGLALTDHDTVEGFEELAKAAKDLDLRVIPGVEFSSAMEKFPIHILGYAFDPTSAPLLHLTSLHTKRRQERIMKMIDLLSLHNLPISQKDMAIYLPTAVGQMGRAHLGYVLCQKGLVSSMQEAFDRWIGEGKPCFVESETPSIEETLEVIHAANGLAVLAHPHLIKNKGIVRRLLKLPFDGIEARYALFPLEACQRFIDLAKNKNLLITGGSDYHGEIKPRNPLGGSVTDEKTFHLLEEKFLTLPK